MIQFVYYAGIFSNNIEILIVKIVTPGLILGPNGGLKLNIDMYPNIFKHHLLKNWNAMICENMHF